MNVEIWTEVHNIVVLKAGVESCQESQTVRVFLLLLVETLAHGWVIKNAQMVKQNAS